MKVSTSFLNSAVAAILLSSVAIPAQATTIVLHDIGGVTPGSLAEKGFTAAAEFWGRALTNDVTIRLNVGYSALPENVLGSTRSTFVSTDTRTVQNQIRAGGTTSLDAVVKNSLPTLDAAGALSVVTSGFQDPLKGLGVDTSYQVFDNDGSDNNALTRMTSANAKALGLDLRPRSVDGEITFSNEFLFDFAPGDGIGAKAIDFIGVATHEIGHALGFVSGVDRYDYLGAPGGPQAESFADADLQSGSWGETLDLFRYSDNPNGFADGDPLLDWSVGTDSYFSIDGGKTAFMDGYFSTGAFNGDGRQASHWKDAPSKSQFGIMDPTVAHGQMSTVTALDLAAMDAIGWNTRTDVLANPGYGFSSSNIYSSTVPEPAAWALMIVGFGLVGTAVRRRRAAVAPDLLSA
jgi:hypothetical protein